MCRSKTHGGRRCGAAAHSAAAAPAAPAPSGSARLSRAQFLRTPVTDLAVISPDGSSVAVSPKPAGMSEKAYREHLESGPRMVLWEWDGDRATPERLRGGCRSTGLDPESARILAVSAQRRGRTVEVRWQS